MNIHLLWMAFLFCALISCNVSAADGSGLTGRLEEVNLQLKWRHQFQFAGYYAALHLGYYQAENLKVNILEGGANKSAPALVSAGSVQYGVSDSDILLDYLSGKPIVVISAIFQHSPYILLSRYDSNIRTPSDLVGKRIMLGDNQGGAQLKAMLKHEGINLNQLKIIPQSWSLDDLINRRVDAVSAYISVEPNLLRSKGVRPAVLNSTNYGVDFYGDTLFTSRNELKNHPERVAAFLRASQKGWAYALEHKAEMADLILKMDGVQERGITKALLLSEADAMDPLILHDVVEVGHINPGRWKHIADELVDLGLISKDYDLAGFIYEPNNPVPALTRKNLTIGILLIVAVALLAGAWLFRQRRKLHKNAQRLNTEVIRRQEAEVNLEKTQAQLDELFRITAAGIAVTTHDGRYLLANPAYCEMLGYTEAELLTKDFISLTYEEDRQRNRVEIQKLLDGAVDSLRLEKRYVKKNGDLVWVRLSITAIRSADGKLVKLTAVTEDITEQLAMVAKLKRSEALLKIAGNLAQLGGWDIDLNTMQMTWSDEVSIMHDLAPGVTPTYEEGLSMVVPEYRAHIERQFQNCMRNGKPYDEEFQKLTAKNRLIWVRSVGNAVRDEQNNIVRVQGAFQEITAYKNLEIFNHKQTLILEDIATGKALVKVLEDCVRLLEGQYPELICAVNLLDESGKRLKTGTSFNLPAEYLQAINGLEIGAEVGSCGTAAYLQKEVIVSDIATDPLWEKYKEFALKHHLLACWSWPILSSKNLVIGTFAAYSRTISSPTEEAKMLIGSVAKTAGIAIEKEKSSEQIRLLESAVSRLDDIVLITEAEPIVGTGPAVVYVNDAFERRTGYSREEIIGKTPRILQGEKTQRSELKRIHDALEKWQPVRAELINYKKSGEEFWLELEIAPIADVNGWFTHWAAVERDITTRKKSELEMARLNRALRLLSACNDVLIRANDEKQLINEICKLAVEIGGYRMAWVGFALEDGSKSIMPVGSYGKQDDFLDHLNLSWSDTSPRGAGPGGRTIRGGKTVVVEDIANDPTYPAIPEAIQQGYLGLVSLPLLDKESCIGLIAMYAAEVRSIPVEEIRLLEELADDLCFGILSIRAKIEQEKMLRAVVKVASSVSIATSNQFFEQLAQNMMEATNSDAGFIARLLPDATLKARTLAAVVDGKAIDNIEYDVQSSPCRHLLDTDHFTLSKSLTDCLSPSETMVSLGMSDYIGHRLVNSKGQVIGMIFVMKRALIKQNDFVISTLKIFATRAAAEIERQDYDRHISQQASLLDKAQDAIIVRDMERRIQFWNKGAERLYGWSQSEVLGKTIVDLIYPNRIEFFEAEKLLFETGEWRKEVSQRHKSGKEVFAEVHWTLVSDDKGQPLSVLCINTDVSERKAAAEEIQHLAFYDALTGLPNRLLLQDRLQHAIASSTRNKKYGALLFIDIDNFKSINDTIGHSAGDVLLKMIGTRLSENTRDSDTVARLGGDEFIILLEELSIDLADAAIQSKLFSEKLLQIFQEPFEIDQHKHHSTPSIGITLFQGDAQSVNELLKQADLAMYQAKASGRNTLRFYDPQMQTTITNRVELEADLRQSLKKNELIMYYQPQIDIENNCVGAEALLRWQHGTKGMISPLSFIPLAEETQLIIPIGEWVFKTACETLVRWAAIPELAHMTLAVNVSVNQFRQSDFVHQLKRIIDATGVNPAQLKLELTESLFAENIQDIITKMTALKALGIIFSLDDFGTGYSSLNYLKRLPLNQLKIDQSFVREILSDSHDATICRSIISLAKSLDLEVIAEGVELLQQKEFLHKEGCHLYQGYYFSKPIPIDDLETFIIGKHLAKR